MIPDRFPGTRQLPAGYARLIPTDPAQRVALLHRITDRRHQP